MRIVPAILTLSVLLAVSASAAKYAGDPFSLGAGARALGMGGAVIAGPFDATSGYWNPAGLAQVVGRQIQTMHAETFGSLLNHEFVGYSSNNGKARGLTSYGFYLYSLWGDGIKITGFDPQRQWPYVIREESHLDLMLGASLAGKAFERFSYGATAKLIYRDIAVESAYGLGLDVGGVYDLNPHVAAAMTVTDITTTFLAYSNDNTEIIYPAVKPAISYRWWYGDVMIAGSGQAIIRFEGRNQTAELWQGNISADFQAGLEFSYRQAAFGRLGYDQDRFTAGLGASFSKYLIDLAYLHHADLDDTFRISAGLKF